MAHGGSITKRGKDLYEVSCQIGKREDGSYERAFRRVHGKKRDAVEALDELRHLDRSREHEGPEFGAFAAEWLTLKMTSGEWARKTQIHYAWLVDRLCRKIGATPLEKVDARAVNALYAAMKSDYGWSNTTLRKAHMCLKQIMALAVSYDLIAKNPVERVKAPSNDRVDRRSLTPEEFSRLRECLDGAKQTPYVLAAKIGLATGMRRGEVLGLTWGCVDLKRGRLRVKQAYTPQGMARPKTHAGERTIAINESLVDELVRVKPEGAASSTPVAKSQTGGHINPDHFSRWWRSFTARNGFAGLKFHELRHTQATLLLGAGSDVKVVQARLGHTDAAMTLNFYAHSLPENDRRAAESIELLMAGRG